MRNTTKGKNSSKKYCLVTLGLENPDFLTITRPLMERYAKRINCEFKVVMSYNMTDKANTYNRTNMVKMMVIYNMLQLYDRIIFMDNNCCVSDRLPNLFEIVDDNMLGGQQEGILRYITTYHDDYNYIKQKLDRKSVV